MEYVRAEITGNTVLLMKFAKLHAIFFFLVGQYDCKSPVLI